MHTDNKAAAFAVDQRVLTTVDAPAMWPGATAAPEGSLGTVTDVWDSGDVGVILDVDPDHMPATYHADDLKPLR